MNHHKLSYPAILALALVISLATVTARAGNDTWAVAGQPSGGNVLKTVVNPATPSTLYACAYGGTYKSTDSGASWTLVLPQFNEPYDIAIEPENPTTLYVATGANGGIEVSTDGGNTWTIVNNGIGTIPGLTQKDTISHVSVDPVTDGIAYVVGLNTGIYKTTNHGQSWSSINTGLTSLISSQATFGEMSVDPVNPQVLYLPVSFPNAPNSAAGIYKSTDGGAHWNPSKTGLPVTIQVVVDPNNDAHVFALANYEIYASTDSGTTWAPLNSSPPVVTVLRFNPQNSQNLIAVANSNSLYISTDGGTTWAQGASSTFFYIEDVAVNPVTPANLYVSTSAFGVYKSTDGGQTMTESDTGLHAVADMQSMAMGSDGAIYIGSASGVFKSADQGAVWTSVNSGMTNNTTDMDVSDLVEDPTTPATLYAGTVGGLFKSTNAGTSWTLLNNGITDPYTFAVAVDPENTLTVYAGTNTGGVFKSTDGGSTWQSASIGLPNEPISSLAVDPTNSNVVFAGTQSNGMYQSTNGGNSWGADNIGLPLTANILAVVIDPINDKIVYASIYANPGDGIYKSSDGGGTWSSAGNGIPQGNGFPVLIMDPANSSILYAVPNNPAENAFVTTDGGTNWQPLTPLGLPTTPVPVEISGLAIDPQHPANVYGAATDGQVYAFSSLTPMATAGSVVTLENTPINGQLTGSLSGFTGQLSFDIATQPAHGTVTITNQTSGAFTYTPTTGFIGQDSFTFTVSAAGAISTPATETVTINPPPPTTSNGSVTTTENQSVNGTLLASGTAPLSFSVVNQPAHGTVKITNTSAGAFTYKPASGFSGTDSFTFNASNVGGTSSAATETVTIVPLPPTASNASITTAENTPVTSALNATGGGTLSFAIKTRPAHGTVTLTSASTGAFTYTPASGFSGTDSFTFNASNVGGTSSAATETITVTASSSGTGGSSGGGGSLGLLGLLALAGLGLTRRTRRHS